MSAFSEFLVQVERLLARHPLIRPGQAHYNQLSRQYPEIAEEVNPVDLDAPRPLDPYYDDEKLPEFLKFVQRRLGEDPGEGAD